MRSRMIRKSGYRFSERIMPQKRGRQTRVRPRASPNDGRDQEHSTAMKKIALAISTDAPAMPPKPRTPAIRAMTRKRLRPQLMAKKTKWLYVVCWVLCALRRVWRAFTEETMRAGKPWFRAGKTAK